MQIIVAVHVAALATSVLARFGLRKRATSRDAALSLVALAPVSGCIVNVCFPRSHPSKRASRNADAPVRGLGVSLRVAHHGVDERCRKQLRTAVLCVFVADGAMQRGQGLGNRSAARQLAHQCIWCDIMALLVMAPSADKKK